MLTISEPYLNHISTTSQPWSPSSPTFPGHHLGRRLLPGRPRPDGPAGPEQRGPCHAAGGAQGRGGQRQGALDPLGQSPDSAGRYQLRWGKMGKGWEKGEMSRVSMWSRFGNYDGGLGLDEQLRGKKKMGEKTWEDIV